ncbi:hypothetical protein [Pelotomaculum propionicicum]|uniref:hypothetical protein n=1 Tax=Pelotomaculum propionicicum TaxID=258475 RepID=UPI001066099D|nr:hypothetical protein [Pelotomaculum propionicicum]NLI11697.1 hypothetical protein [Peptococcaceae bacterium]
MMVLQSARADEGLIGRISGQALFRISEETLPARPGGVAFLCGRGAIDQRAEPHGECRNSHRFKQILSP